MNIQPTFKVGDLVTGLTVDYRGYQGLVCPITVLRVDDIIEISGHYESGFDGEYTSGREAVGHHQQVVCGDHCLSGAIVEKVNV